MSPARDTDGQRRAHLTLLGGTGPSAARERAPRAVDPNEPPLPPKVTFEQTRNLVEALARGTPDAAQIARNIALGKIRELI